MLRAIYSFPIVPANPCEPNEIRVVGEDLRIGNSRGLFAPPRRRGLQPGGTRGHTVGTGTAAAILAEKTSRYSFLQNATAPAGLC